MAMKSPHRLFLVRENNMKKFLLSVNAEMKQVQWPTRSKVIAFTIVIVVVSLVVAYLLGAFDALFGYGLRTLLLK